MKKNITLIALCIHLCTAVVAQLSSSVIVYKKDTAFTCIAVDSITGNVYAGTNAKGMWKFDQKTWKNWSTLSSAFGKSNLRQVAVSGGDVWVASSGYVVYLGSPDAGNNVNFWGGIHKIDQRLHIKSTYYRGRNVLGQQNSLAQGPPSRNVLGVTIDSTGRPWCAASYHDSMTYPAFLNYNGRYHFAPGAVGMFNGTNFNFLTGTDLPDPTGILIGIGNNYKDENYSSGKRRTCRSIAQVGNEMWVGSDGYEKDAGTTITAGILRYGFDGTYIGKYEQNNTSVPFGLTNFDLGPVAIYKDTKGRVWATFGGSKGIAVFDSTGWHYLGVPSVLPAITIFRAHALASNPEGEVFFGTSNGLLVYKGSGSYTDAASWSVYTTAQGLSSNAVSGIAIAKDKSIWLATAFGVNKLSRGDLIVYNLFRDFTTPSVTDNDNFRRVIALYSSKDPQATIDKDTLFIAADSSKATIFKWTGSNPKNLKFRITDAAASYDPQQHGSFAVKYLNPTVNDSIRLQYQHPSYINDLYTVSTQFNGKNVRLEVVDTTVTPEVIVLTIPVKIVLPPLLIMHGIWSDADTWKEMRSYLSTNGLYRYKAYEIFAPSYAADREFTYNRSFIGSYISTLIENCGLNRMSAGKVDVVAHSMGGILTRLHIQEGLGSSVYYKNIHKLITINTPHSGSPMANIVENKDGLFKWILKKTGRDPFKGALSDLSIGKSPIDSLLNGPDLNRNVVPSHVIHTTDMVPGWAEFANDKISTFVKSPITLKSQFYPLTGKILPNPWVIGAKAFLFSVKYYLTSNTSCPWDTQLNPCFEKIFGGPSDLVVSNQSQIGGMADAETYLNSFHHLSVHKSPPTSIKVLELLRAKTNTGLFSWNGFHPKKFQWDEQLGTQPARVASGSVQIISPLPGATFNAGDSVHVTVRATGINRILFGMAYEDDIDGFAKEAPDSVFSFKIPPNVIDIINYKIFGFGASGSVSTDSSYINIGVNSSLVLDSIKIDHPSLNDMKVTIGDSTAISVIGYYNDGLLRNVTYQTGVAYTMLAGSVITSSEGNVRGVSIGFDEIKASFKGKTDSVVVEVVSKTVFDTVKLRPLPVRFLKLTARYEGASVGVSWTTASEINNHHFEVEHSTNGKDYIPAGVIAATNKSSEATYYFKHIEYAKGKNYYRIKQVDNDGKFMYSPVAMVNISEKDGILIYPNPADDIIVVDFTKANNKNASLVRIINAIGQIVQQQVIVINTIKLALNVGRLKPGIYVIEIIGNDKKTLRSEKFIKNR